MLLYCLKVTKQTSFLRLHMRFCTIVVQQIKFFVRAIQFSNNTAEESLSEAQCNNGHRLRVNSDADKALA